MRGRPWTDEDIALLKRLWAAGTTASAIAARLGGLSRSAILGKIFRLRLDAGAQYGGTQSRPKRRVVNQAASDSPLAGAAPIRRRGKTRPDSPPPHLIRNKRGKTLLELTNDNCRWPFGRPGSEKFHFCGIAGADVERGMPYCAKHMQRAYFACTGVERPKQQTTRAA